jgi:hypothetical protein
MPGRPLFGASAANFRKLPPAAVDTRKQDRGPLLIVAGGQDDTVPQVVARAAASSKPSRFRSILANDLPASQAAELAATQRPVAASTLTEPSGPPARRCSPTRARWRA